MTIENGSRLLRARRVHWDRSPRAVSLARVFSLSYWVGTQLHWKTSCLS